MRSYEMYKLVKHPFNNTIFSVERLLDNAFIPFDQANTDYANFKKDIANNVELQDQEGNLIDGVAYLAALDKEQK